MININIREANKCNGDYSLYISFDYNADIVDKIKSLSTRFYNKDTKEWEVPFKSLTRVVDLVSEYDIEISGKYINLHADEEVELPKDFEFKTKPFEHQIDGVKFGLSHNKWLLGDEQGLGKTKQVIDLAIARNVKHCLIICCVNGLKWNWNDEVHTHSNSDAWILGYRNGKIASSIEKLEDLQNIDELPRFIITNIETLRYAVPTGNIIQKRVNGKLKEIEEVAYPITDRLKELCDAGDIEMIAIDEFHKCKNPDAIQAQQVLRLQADYQVAMTGTPLMNAPLDLFMPLKWLGYEKHSFYQFKSHHCLFGGYGGYQVTGYRYLEELTDTLDEIMLRRLKDDVLDLPEKTFINDYVEMSDKQRKLYLNTHKELVSNIDKIKMASNPLSEMIRLRQATGNPAILADIKDNAKFDRMEEIVDDAVENGQKVVIFSNWVQMTNPAFKRLAKKYGGTMITGETKDNERKANKDKFQNDPRCKFIIGTIGAMGTGLTLTAGTVEIFLDEPWNMALKEQAIDRCHRIGQKSNITVYTLLCKDTIDERINEVVEKKGAMSDILVDGKIEGDKNALINYLLS